VIQDHHLVAALDPPTHTSSGAIQDAMGAPAKSTVSAAHPKHRFLA
jgi:hypothetical protein